jgi:predicted nuclease of restriction endonuclease-like (RecB) superfamily
MSAMTGTGLPLPSDYGVVRDNLERQVRASRAAAFRAANAEMLALYRTIGRLLDRQQRQGWTAEELDRLIAELRATFPEMASLSPANLAQIQRFAAAWPDSAIAPAVEQLPWGHIRVLLDRVDDPETRDWFAAAAVEHGWSENVLLNQIMAGAHRGAPATT